MWLCFTYSVLYGSFLIFSDDFQTAQLLSIILDLLTFCVEHHSYHIKNYIISKDVMSRVLVLLRSRHAFLILCKYFDLHSFELREEHTSCIVRRPVFGVSDLEISYLGRREIVLSM